MNGTHSSNETWIALCGGIGGAKLALGLKHVLPIDTLTLIVNTGDDFRHLGLHVSPDIDTVTYTLAGLSNTELGWGLAGESWSFMDALARVGGPTWFRLGDGDLATHVTRTQMLAEGLSLTDVTRTLAQRLGAGVAIVPMSDDPVATLVDTDEGTLPFQTYFVGRRAEPKVKAIRFDGAATARGSSGALAALADPRLAGIIICPSNPWLSIDPLLSVASLATALRDRRVPCVAVTPLIGGQSVKGPTAKIMAELGHPLHPSAIAAHYSGLIDGFVLDVVDSDQAGRFGIPTQITNTLMRSLEDRTRLADATLAFCRTLQRRPQETT